jgi:uncharacterized protein DUF4231
VADSEVYLKERLIPRMDWYDRRAVLFKRLHLLVQYAAMTGSIMLVLLIHIEQIPRSLLAIVAAFVTLCLAAARIGRFGELWWIYRLSAESLATEMQLFRHGVGPYEVEPEAARSALLVERCEELLTHESKKWVRTMQGQGTESPRPDVVVE